MTKANYSCLASLWADALEQHLEGAVAGGGPSAIEWRHSSSCNGGACVEVASPGEKVAVRDSANADGVLLAFTKSNWRCFIADVKAGKFAPVS